MPFALPYTLRPPSLHHLPSSIAWPHPSASFPSITAYRICPGPIYKLLLPTTYHQPTTSSIQLFLHQPMAPSTPTVPLPANGYRRRNHNCSFPRQPKAPQPLVRSSLNQNYHHQYCPFLRQLKAPPPILLPPLPTNGAPQIQLFPR